ncbi:SGNH/GDSL hydrolase family protein [Streptomyces sp. NPDC005480]|uniref:SGNH/GDSL hydrolase family protein n=1 Tax=Streptomyces sp. NPDC005480 TaxID=3154880 RepID=UPI0033A330BF
MRRLLPASRAGRALALGATLLCAGAALAPAEASSASVSLRTEDHVALGDSYAAAPFVPTQVDAVCARSNQNYPSLVARSRSASLMDVSCAGATTEDMTAPQAAGTAPQLDALDRGTYLVTLTIGGNDIGFSTVLGTCAQLTPGNPPGAPCRTYFTGTGTDWITEAIVQTGPKVAHVLRGIHRRAPHARVAVVGYPDLFPDNGVGCTSKSVPLAAGDFAWLRDKEQELNGMLAREARRARVTYVNTYAPTVGHDLCKPTGERWIETFAPETPAAPVHPNATGESAMADAVERALPRRGPHH